MTDSPQETQLRAVLARVAESYPRERGDDAGCFYCGEWSTRHCTICEDATYSTWPESTVQLHYPDCPWVAARLELGLPVDICGLGHDDTLGPTRGPVHGPWPAPTPAELALTASIMDAYREPLRRALDEPNLLADWARPAFGDTAPPVLFEASNPHPPSRMRERFVFVKKDPPLLGDWEFVDEDGETLEAVAVDAPMLFHHHVGPWMVARPSTRRQKLLNRLRRLIGRET